MAYDDNHAMTMSEALRCEVKRFEEARNRLRRRRGIRTPRSTPRGGRTTEPGGDRVRAPHCLRRSAAVRCRPIRGWQAGRMVSTLVELRRLLGEAAVSRGLSYVRQGRVREVAAGPDGCIDAQVQGTERAPYV